ncbi:MAG: hypothetical protein ING89_16700 [Rubrivivax sp.]|nr:hypothetical protein [Rubrivivax sp.]
MSTADVSSATPTNPSPASAPPPVWPPPSLGWLEVALPLWSRRWRLLLSALVLGLGFFAVSLFRPLIFVGQSSFVVTTVQRPSNSVGAGGAPGLTLIAPGGASPIDLHVAMLRSRVIGDRLVERFDLVRAWQLRDAASARALLSRRLDFTIARREGVVYVEASDVHPQRAAAIANQAVEELKLVLRGFALDEAKQRRNFYEQQLERARQSLETAQRQLRASGFDRAALRTEPGAAAASYARQQAEITAAEVRLAALLRLRAEGSPEVQMARTEIAAMRSQLARLEVPRDEGSGGFGGRVRELRYAEQLVETLTRQLEAARFDVESEPVPVQMLDRAQPVFTPASPNPVLWALGGLALGFGLQAVWVLVRHRSRLARQDEHYRQRLEQVRAVLPVRRQGRLRLLLKSLWGKRPWAERGQVES